MLGICGAFVLVSAAPAPDLVGRSNWVLAGALPSTADFPADWHYSVSGPLGWAEPPDAAPGGWPRDPAPVYTPAQCGELPALFTATGSYIGYARAERPSAMLRADLVAPPDAAATGEQPDPGPIAYFQLTAPTDPASLLAGYRVWLAECGTYRVRATDPMSGATHDREVTTVLEEDPTAAEGLVVTRRYVPVGAGEAAAVTFAVRYYAVRGLLLETSTTLTGEDRELTARLADQAAERLQAL